MSNSDLVRPSRDGDQFHYLWASRRCLRLLLPTSGLVAISIEGSSKSENNLSPSLEAGEDIIDVGEYYGSEVIKYATLVRYIQLKHSTRHAKEHWVASGLEDTITGFSDRYKEIEQLREVENFDTQLEFCFISNRPISSDFLETIDDAANMVSSRHPKELKKIETFTGLNGLSLSNFCKLLKLEGNHVGYWEQRNLLAQETNGYLPGGDVDAPIQLKELVTRKALSENSETPTITKIDVLRALKTDEDWLFPAPCLIEDSKDFIIRDQEASIIDQIINASSRIVIVHAEGGVGKSIFSTRIKSSLPNDSVCIVYDCFGNGQYRSASKYRHRHKDALVQIANELASKGLCHPLIPAVNAEPSAYIKAFLHRLNQSITILRADQPNALLCIAIDAADNAQMAANEINETRSFAQDLLREEMPDGVRLVILCRTHRQVLLDPPPHIPRIELQPFTRTETAAHLLQTFPDATDHDIDEFHRLSSQNPRVQATSLSKKATLSETLRALGPNPTTVEDTIANLLDYAIAELRDKSGLTERNQIDLICQGLAALRPLIPTAILASLAGVEEAAVRSFAIDLGRPLITIDNTLQFFDEPAETWFRERFKPNKSQLIGFIEILKPMALASAYVASALPQLMLEADQFRELVDLALSSEGLPNGNQLERRDVELQRLQFALKAALRTKQYKDAAKLALKAGGETAGNDRQQKILQDNTDLSAIFMDVDRVHEVVSRRIFADNWMGSHYVYEAGFMSGKTDLHADARSRLRMANEWLKNWSRLPHEERESEQIEDEDIAEIALAHFNIHGPDMCAKELRRWKPREVSFRAGRILARRFVDHGRYDDLNQLAFSATNDVWLILAITLELREVNKKPPKKVIERIFPFLISNRIKIKNLDRWYSEEIVLQSITAFVEAGLTYSSQGKVELAALLARFLPHNPPRGLSSRFDKMRFPFLRAYTLHATLIGKSVQLDHLADNDLRKELKKSSHHNSREIYEFKETIGALLPWHQLWANVTLGFIPTHDIESAIDKAKSESATATRFNYAEDSSTFDEIARQWFDILLCTDSLWPSNHINDFNTWIDSLRRPLYTPTLNYFARAAARKSGLEQQCLVYTNKSFLLTRAEKEDAELKAIAYIKIARAVLAFSESEAAAYFNEAVEVSSKIGNENLYRWSAILDLADRATTPDNFVPETAYKLARCAELTYQYVDRDKHFDWEATVTAISGLCPTSSISILSRWRDRNFGSAARLLPTVIEFLIGRKIIDPKTALGLIGFRANWDENLLIKSALETCKSKSEKTTALDFVYRYMRLDEQTASKWQNLKEIAVLHGLELPEIDELILFHSLKQIDKTDKKNYSSDANQQKGDGWDSIFLDVDLSTTNDIVLVFNRFKKSEKHYSYDIFFEEIFNRIKIGKESEFIRKLVNIVEFDVYRFRDFLKQLPQSWETQLAVKSALAEIVKIMCRRYCMDISKNRYYEIFPFKRACELSGVTEIELIEVILSAIGELTEIVDAERLFILIAFLAPKLSNTDAHEALLFGLELFDHILNEDDGDGKWSLDLIPPVETDAAIAGYIWAALAAPETNLRWEAAHTIRGLCTLKQEKVIFHLINLAKTAKGGPFVDACLQFYHLHALQWLMIALARVSKENPESIKSHGDFLIQTALNGQFHVLIRDFAASATLSLSNEGCLSLDLTTRKHLENINVSQLPVINSSRYDMYEDQYLKQKFNRENNQFDFGIDIGPHWFATLGRCFGVNQAKIEELATHIIVHEWGYKGYDYWNKDERQYRGIFKSDETYISKSSYPRVDNFFLAHIPKRLNV